MSKSQSFSIFLLKERFTDQNSLKENHGLINISDEATGLPSNATLFLADPYGSTPWWKEYWGITRNLKQTQKGAIVFLPVSNRVFALTFGMTHHKLEAHSFEYDFGLRTTLNAIDPKKIRSTDTLRPDSAKRQRTQSPVASNLNFFDIKHDESILKRLTGSVKSEHLEMFKNATGATSLRVTSKVTPEEITALCSKLFEIYNLQDYISSFPDIQNIVPIKDPDIIDSLDNKLLDAFQTEPYELVLAIPDIVDYSSAFRIKFIGGKKSIQEYHDVYIGAYRQYLEMCEIPIVDDISIFKKHRMQVLDENGHLLSQYPVYNTFLFDCELDGGTYHLTDGEWYQINRDFISKLKEKLDPFFVIIPSYLQECGSQKEDEYNTLMSTNNSGVICLDKKNISPQGQSQIEPCDLCIADENHLKLIHIKFSTRSSTLSHLFNQGVNSVEALRMSADSREKLKLLTSTNGDIAELIDKEAYRVVYGIVTNKDPQKKSLNLPIFSRISLLRVIDSLRLMGLSCQIIYIKDNVNRKTELISEL